MEYQNNIKPDWVVYYEVRKYEWDCPLCLFTNVYKESPANKTVRCFKCGSYFDKVRDGEYLKKEE